MVKKVIHRNRKSQWPVEYIEWMKIHRMDEKRERKGVERKEKMEE